MGLLVQPFHLRVETGGRLGSLGELAHQRRRDVGAVLVVDLVLEAGPEVHGDSADLKFHRHRNHPVGQMHGDLDQRVQTPVPVGLRPRDVVLDLQHRQVGLAPEQLEDPVDVDGETAGHPDSSNVRDVLPQCRDAQFDAAADGLLADALR